MYIEAIEVTGLGGVGALDLALERTTRVAGSGRANIAFQDALALAFSAWDMRILQGLLDRWGCVGAVIEGAKTPEGAHWESAPGLGGVLAPAADGLVTIGLKITLDPPQYGKLRALSARDPRLVDALADGARLTVRTGARFSPALDALAIDPLGFVVGEEVFPIAGAERPVWMTPFLSGLAGRLQIGEVPGSLWGEKAASYKAADQRAVQRALAALAAPPASFGAAVAMPDGPAALMGDTLVTIRHLGAAARYAAGVVGAVHLSGAEILVVEARPEWVDWLTAQAEADNSALEQVILVGVEGGITLG